MSALQFSTQHFSARRIHSGPAIDKLLYWTKFSHIPKVHSFFKQCLLNVCLAKKSGKHCTVFRKAYILSGSGFHKFMYSMIESFKKIREIAEFISNQLRFHEKNFS